MNCTICSTELPTRKGPGRRRTVCGTKACQTEFARRRKTAQRVREAPAFYVIQRILDSTVPGSPVRAAVEELGKLTRASSAEADQEAFRTVLEALDTDPLLHLIEWLEASDILPPAEAEVPWLSQVRRGSREDEFWDEDDAVSDVFGPGTVLGVHELWDADPEDTAENKGWLVTNRNGTPWGEGYTYDPSDEDLNIEDFPAETRWDERYGWVTGEGEDIEKVWFAETSRLEWPLGSMDPSVFFPRRESECFEVHHRGKDENPGRPILTIPGRDKLECCGVAWTGYTYRHCCDCRGLFASEGALTAHLVPTDRPGLSRCGGALGTFRGRLVDVGGVWTLPMPKPEKRQSRSTFEEDRTDWDVQLTRHMGLGAD